MGLNFYDVVLNSLRHTEAGAHLREVVGVTTMSFFAEKLIFPCFYQASQLNCQIL